MACGEGVLLYLCKHVLLVLGQGVTAAILKEHNIPTYSEVELTEESLVELLGDDEER